MILSVERLAAFAVLFTNIIYRGNKSKSGSNFFFGRGKEAGCVIFESADNRFLAPLGDPEYGSGRLLDEYNRNNPRTQDGRHEPRPYTLYLVRRGRDYLYITVPAQIDLFDNPITHQTVSLNLGRTYYIGGRALLNPYPLRTKSL